MQGEQLCVSLREQAFMARQLQEAGVAPGAGPALHNPDIMLPREPVGQGACLYPTVLLLKHRTLPLSVGRSGS